MVCIFTRPATFSCGFCSQRETTCRGRSTGQRKYVVDDTIGKATKGLSQGDCLAGTMHSTPRDAGQLCPSFRKRDGIALVVSSVVGVGIFTTPSVVANLVPSPIAMLGLWLTGGALALIGASCYARLAEMWPKAGGEYLYLSRSYGPVAGFLSGWTSLIAGFSGAIAASSVAAVMFAGQYFPSLAADHTLISKNVMGFEASLSTRSLAATEIIVLFAVLHISSLATGKKVQGGLALLLVGFIVVFLACGFATGHGRWSHFRAPAVQFPFMNWLLALIPVMFTYSGWNAAVYIAEEIHGSQKSMRPILLSGTAIVGVLYLALNSLYLYAIPATQMHSSPNIADAAARALFAAENSVITPVLIVALLGAISAMTIAGPRVYFAMARDGNFIAAFAQTSPGFNTPALAIALQAVWSIVLVLLGRFEQILMYAGFALVLSSGAAVAALFFVRQTDKQSTWTQMIPPAVFVFASLAMVVNTILKAPGIALVGVALIAAGLPVYGWCHRNQTLLHRLQAEEAAGD